MSKTNDVRLIGHLGKDPETVGTGSDVSIARFTMSTQERFTDGQGNKKEQTDWHQIVAFGQLAKLITTHLKKGAHVSVNGRLQTRSYTDQKGDTRYTTEVVCEEILFLGKPKSQQQS